MTHTDQIANIDPKYIKKKKKIAKPAETLDNLENSNKPSRLFTPELISPR